MSVGISNNYATLQKNERKISFEGKINARKFIELTPGSPVSDAFVKEMAQGLESIDSRVSKQIIKGQNLKIKLAQKTSDAFPELKGVTPRGWTPGKTFDNCPALSRAGGIIGLFEKPIDQPKPSPNTVVHETGHTLDKLFIKIFGNRFVNTEGYTEAYLKDITNLPENMKKYSKKVKHADSYINYTVQGSTPKKAAEGGKAEAFAEIFADLNGGGSQEIHSKGMDKLYKQVFPNTTAYVEKLLYLMGKR